MAAFFKRGHRTCVFLFVFFFLLLTLAASKKHGSSFPRAAFLDAATVFSLKPRV